MGEKARKQIVLNALERFAEKHCLIVGDSILDEYAFVRQTGYSLEQPDAPKFRYESSDFSYGGAANVAKNILALGARATFITVLGCDSYAGAYQNFKHQNLHFIPIREEGRNTTVKTRFWDVKEQKERFRLNRSGRSNEAENDQITAFTQAIVYGTIQRAIGNVERMLLVDYRHGMMTSSLIDGVKDLARRKEKEIFASSQISQKPSNHQEYADVTMVCMNIREAKAVDTSFSSGDRNALREGLCRLAEKLDANICVTLGKEGSAMQYKGFYYQANGIQVEEKDPTGAGDCFLAALSLADFEKDPELALYLANIWAGLSVTKVGTQTPSLEELTTYLQSIS